MPTSIREYINDNEAGFIGCLFFLDVLGDKIEHLVEIISIDKRIVIVQDINKKEMPTHMLINKFETEYSCSAYNGIGDI